VCIARDLAVAQIEYLPHRRIDQSTAARSASLDPAENKNLVAAEIAKILPDHAVLIPSVVDLTNVRFDALAPPQNTAADSHRHRREPFDILVHALQDGIEIATVEGIYHPLGDLHLRLRHRLPPRLGKPLGGCAALVDVGVRDDPHDRVLGPLEDERPPCRDDACASGWTALHVADGVDDPPTEINHTLDLDRPALEHAFSLFPEAAHPGRPREVDDAVSSLPDDIGSVWADDRLPIPTVSRLEQAGDDLNQVGVVDSSGILPAVSRSSNTPAMPSNLDLVRSISAGWERGDFSRNDWADPDIEFVIADGPEPGSWTGLAGMAEGFRSALSGWNHFRAEAEEYRELEDGTVLVLLRAGSGRGKMSGLEIGQMRTTGANLFQLRDGKVTRLVIYLDRERARADLGLTPDTGT
jgi:ketosteroid isomerase-like protein